MPIVVPSSVGDHCVTVNTGNGAGSTNTLIRRFAVIERNVGGAIGYADSAASGASFTINAGGLFSIVYVDGANSVIFGVSKNSSQLSTGINNINAADRLMLMTNAAGGSFGLLSGVFRLSAGDVIRPHGAGAGTSTQDPIKFEIRKVGA